ncbi:MAG: DsrE/DsrF/DrsH-like family protein [Nitrospirae bacterium]|nr:DsrE/DsrF/DrsH-like family protein [Nitrospirota bacterium]
MIPGIDQKSERVTIILHSGSFDRVSYALSLAGVSLAMEMEVHMLLTYGGLGRFVKGHLEDLGEETDTEIKHLIARGLASGGIQSLSYQLSNARELGLKLYACANAMGNMNIIRQDLMEAVDEVMGLATFLAIARTANINWYI